MEQSRKEQNKGKSEEIESCFSVNGRSEMGRERKILTLTEQYEDGTEWEGTEWRGKRD